MLRCVNLLLKYHVRRRIYVRRILDYSCAVKISLTAVFVSCRSIDEGYFKTIILVYMGDIPPFMYARNSMQFISNIHFRVL